MKPLIETPPRSIMEVFKSLPEGTLAEVINNQIYMSPSPVYNHQKILQEIFRKVCVELSDKGRGEVIISPYDVFLDETKNAVQPDLIVVLNESRKIIDPTGHIHGVPDILLEVLSPHNRDRDLILKKDLYERFGVKEYWIVDPENKSAMVYELANKDYQLISEAVGVIQSKLLQLSIAF